MNTMPEALFEPTALGVKMVSHRPLPDGRRFRRVTEVCLPTLRVVPNPRVGKFGRVETIGLTIPIDDTHHRIHTAGRVPERGVMLPRGKDAATRQPWVNMTAEECRARPNDYEAQVGQGPITLHSEENLATGECIWHVAGGSRLGVVCLDGAALGAFIGPSVPGFAEDHFGGLSAGLMLIALGPLLAAVLTLALKRHPALATISTLTTVATVATVQGR